MRDMREVFELAGDVPTNIKRAVVAGDRAAAEQIIDGLTEESAKAVLKILAFGLDPAADSFTHLAHVDPMLAAFAIVNGAVVSGNQEPWVTQVWNILRRQCCEPPPGMIGVPVRVERVDGLGYEARTIAAGLHFRQSGPTPHDAVCAVAKRITGMMRADTVSTGRYDVTEPTPPRTEPGSWPQQRAAPYLGGAAHARGGIDLKTTTQPHEAMTPEQLRAELVARDSLVRDLAAALVAVKENDASPPYNYRGKGAFRPSDGEKPKEGRWLTPREIADAHLRKDSVKPFLPDPKGG